MELIKSVATSRVLALKLDKDECSIFLIYCSNELLVSYEVLQFNIFNRKRPNMKGIVKNYFIKQSQQIISTLLLSGILSLSIGPTLLQTATASSKASLKAEPEIIQAEEQLISDRGRGGDDDQSGREDRRNRGNDDNEDEGEHANRLPRAVAKAVRQDLASKIEIPPGKLEIINYSRETWSDGCLGLGTLVEQCLQAQVEGWRVTLSDGRFSWVYRTDLKGVVLRLENQIAGNLPKTVADAVLQAASQQSGLSVSKLRIIGAEQQEWSNGCLGLANPNEVCTQALVSGWLMTVEAGQQKLVYRTNENGSVVKLDEAATAAMLNPVPIKATELPPPLQEKVIFRVIASGGIAGSTYETNLFKDGRVVRVLVNPNGTTSEQQTQISKQQVKQFKKLLKQQEFKQFKNLSYPTPSGAANYITVTLTSKDATTRYTDINQDRLPSSLRAVLQAWEQLVAVE